MIFLEYIIFLIFIYIVFRKENKSYAKNEFEFCKNCGEKIDPNEIYCPICNAQNKKVCDECGSLIDIEWRYCPFCKSLTKRINKQYSNKLEDIDERR